MFFSRWFRRDGRPAQGDDPPPRFVSPAVETLEDRTVPSGGFGHGFPGWPSSSTSTAGPATHLQIIVPENVPSGSSFNVVVEAENASNHLATGYTGTVHLSLGTADAGATLPADYTFTARDHGVHVFHVTLSATGAETITETDTANSSITGSATTSVNPAPVATQLLVVTPEHVTAGVPTSVTVIALDASGHRVTDFTGTVSLTSSDAAAALPTAYTFTANDHGSHTFQVTFQTTGSQSVTATDTATGSVTGQASTTVDAVGAVTHFGVFVLGRAADGSATQVVVEALDANNQVVTDYTGTVHFTSSDSQASLPADYTFTAADNGSHVFSVTFATAGRQTLSVTDTANSSITDSVMVRVLTGLAEHAGFGGWINEWWM
jgi:hypothetical protein